MSAQLSMHIARSNSKRRAQSHTSISYKTLNSLAPTVPQLWSRLVTHPTKPWLRSRRPHLPLDGRSPSPSPSPFLRFAKWRTPWTGTKGGCWIASRRRSTLAATSGPSLRPRCSRLLRNQVLLCLLVSFVCGPWVSEADNFSWYHCCFWDLASVGFLAAFFQRHLSDGCILSLEKWL